MAPPCTDYFRTVVRPKRPYLSDELVTAVVASPEVRHVQSDGRIRLWHRAESLGWRWIRVVLLPDGLTVHNAFLDRDGPPGAPGASP